MAIPDYQSLMLPLLRLTQDSKEHRIGDAAQQLAREVGLTEEELAELLPSRPLKKPPDKPLRI
jgi:restriction system protein